MSFDFMLLREGRVQRRVIAAAGTEDHEIIRALAPKPDEIVLNKVTRSAFSSTGLDQILRNLGVAGLVMAGTTTNACVGLTACDAGDRGYKVVIVEDATAAPTPVLQEATLLNFAFLFGHVRTTEQVLAELGLVGEGSLKVRS
jgi:nicotinamidase-related amidase